MLTGRLLNSQASLNNFKTIATVNYVPGEAFDIIFQLMNQELDIRYMAAAGATVSVDIVKSDGTNLTKSAAVLDTGDRSIWKISILATESTDLIGFDIIATVTEGANISKLVIPGALTKNVVSGDC